MSKNTKWWHEEWTCPACRTTLRKHHKTRHLKSRGHQDRTIPIPDRTLNLKLSDVAFTQFLLSLNARSFKGEERKLYFAARAHREAQES